MPDCVQDTLGGTKTSGPPGTAEVSVPPEPETKRRKKKKNTNNTHVLNSFLTTTSRRVDATHSQGPRGKTKAEIRSE